MTNKEAARIIKGTTDEAKVELLDKALDLYDTLRAERDSARQRAEAAERERDAAVKDLEAMARRIRHQKVNDDACCFACKHNCPVEDYCPGWDEVECFEWRGKEAHEDSN